MRFQRCGAQIPAKNNSSSKCLKNPVFLPNLQLDQLPVQVEDLGPEIDGRRGNVSLDKGAVDQAVDQTAFSGPTVPQNDDFEEDVVPLGSTGRQRAIHQAVGVVIKVFQTNSGHDGASLETDNPESEIKLKRRQFFFLKTNRYSDFFQDDSHCIKYLLLLYIYIKQSLKTWTYVSARSTQRILLFLGSSEP